jgi:hypothetical protein
MPEKWARVRGIATTQQQPVPVPTAVATGTRSRAATNTARGDLVSRVPTDRKPPLIGTHTLRKTGYLFAYWSTLEFNGFS